MSGKPLHVDDTVPLAKLIVDLCSKIVSPSNPVNEKDWQNVMRMWHLKLGLPDKTCALLAGYIIARVCVLLSSCTKELVEVAQNSLKKQSTRAAGLQSWYETTAKEAKAKEEAEAEAKRKKEEEEAKKRAEAEEDARPQPRYGYAPEVHTLVGAL